MFILVALCLKGLSKGTEYLHWDFSAVAPREVGKTPQNGLKLAILALLQVSMALGALG